MTRDPLISPDFDLAHHGKVRALETVAERLLFRARPLVLAVFAVASLFFAWQAAMLRPDASFEKMVPATHPFISQYLAYQNELRPLGNVMRIAVENTAGDIYDRDFLLRLRAINDEVFYIPGVDRGNLKSLWTPNVHWYEVTEDGLRSGLVIGQDFDGSPAALDQVRTNVARSGRIGSLVSEDGHSAVILAPLLEKDPETGQRLDYGAFSRRLESLVRSKYESPTIRIHMTGFAKIVGDLIEGARAIGLFFGLTILLTAALLFGYCRCWRSTLSTIACCLLAVIWQLGLVRLLGMGLDPYSILVPFLTFAIGVSHAVQNVNTMAALMVGGRSAGEAARGTFRLLFIPGTIALVCDAVGFSTLLMIHIDVIRELAVSASIGVAVIILTKMFLLPVLMSYGGIEAGALVHYRRKLRLESQRLSRILSNFARPRWAGVAVAVGLLVLGGASWASRDLMIGDLDPGAPELRPQSRYNRDVAFMSSHYATGPDVFVVMVRTPAGECGAYPAASLVDRFQWTMEAVPGVESSVSLFDVMKRYIAGTNGGDLKWYALTRDRYVSNAVHKFVPSEMYNGDCSMVPVTLFLSDHKAATLDRVVAAAEGFARANNGPDAQFLLAAGNGGIEAATNMVIGDAKQEILLMVYAIVSALLLWEFRSWRVTVAIILPLVITSVLCEAVMAALGLGVKVATLPVIALGVGIGVDYGIYIYNRLEGFVGRGLDLQRAYYETLKTTGAAVGMTGITLAAGVATWLFSDIKFQADMGLLLAFMFLWNMIGAVVMIPALVALLMPRLRQGAAQPAEGVVAALPGLPASARKGGRTPDQWSKSNR
ncbi:MAG: RND family transporter [Telmatospirillum sp.]|nr:RND family transporter [Telmatospirillum sp.]